MPVLLLMLVTLSSCAVNAETGQTGARLYLGVVRVEVPQTRGRVSAVRAQALGLGWGAGAQAGPFAGWSSDDWITADPADCQMLIIIRSGAQAAHARALIQSLGGVNPCLVDQTGSLRSSPPSP